MERRNESQPADLPAPDLILFVLRRAAATVAQDLQERLAGDGIRPSAYAALALLEQRPGARQSQLSLALGMRRTNLVPLLADLVERGLCERRAIQTDRRAAALFLTVQGEAVLRRCEAECHTHEAQFSRRLGADGRAYLMSLLHRLSDGAFDLPR
jgi:DNA-binding MarR family transcriptional regulator